MLRTFLCTFVSRSRYGQDAILLSPDPRLTAIIFCIFVRARTHADVVSSAFGKKDLVMWARAHGAGDDVDYATAIGTVLARLRATPAAAAAVRMHPTPPAAGDASVGSDDDWR